MSASKRNTEPLFRDAPLGELRADTISEHELEKLEQGTPISDLLTIGLCLLSAALPLLVTLLSTSLPSQIYTLFFCAFLIVGLGGGASTKELARQIRARMPEVFSVQQMPPEPPTTQQRETPPN